VTDGESGEEKDRWSIKRWNWFMKWNRKLVPEVRRGILKRTISDFQRDEVVGGRAVQWQKKSEYF